jgi:hypothetical protein
MKNSLDIQTWKNKYIYLLKEEDDWDIDINSWSTLSSDFQELENLVGGDVANNLKIKYKNEFSSPQELLNSTKGMYILFSNGGLKTKKDINLYFQTYGVKLANTLDMRNPVSRAILDQMKNPSYYKQGNNISIFNNIADYNNDGWYIDYNGDEYQEWIYVLTENNEEFSRYIINQFKDKLPKNFNYNDWIEYYNNGYKDSQKDILYSEIINNYDKWEIQYSYRLFRKFWEKLGGKYY